MGHVTPIEWIALLTLGVMVFGRGISELGRPLGRGIAEFKRAFEDLAPGVPPEATVVVGGLVLVLLAVAAWAAVMSAVLVR